MNASWIKQLVLDLYNDDVPRKTIVTWFDGIASQASIYRWIDGSQELSYAYTEDEQKKEFYKILILPGNYKATPSKNRIVLSHQPHFYEVECKLYKDAAIRQKLLENRQKYIGKSERELSNREILRGFKISGIHVGFSHFSPLWIKAFIEEFNVKSIYDPCGGWGHRMLGASSIQYIYNDIWSKSCRGVESIKTMFNLINTTIYNNDCVTFTPSEDYEVVFCCPPYFNVEIYGTPPFIDIDAYRTWWCALLKAAMKPTTKYFAFVINTDLYDMLNAECRQSGILTFIRSQPVGTLNVQSHFNRHNKTPRGEHLCIYKRN